jgi:ADP-heptose:LPS heptosyltransferase
MTSTASSPASPVHNIQKIAIFRSLYVGDMLCIIPTVRAIRKGFPQASISLIGLPWQQAFVQRFAHYFDEHIVAPGLPGLPEQPFDAIKAVDFLAAMQQRSFDLVLQMQGNGAVTNALCSLFNARYTAGLRRDQEYHDDCALFPISPDTDHEITRFLKLVDALGICRQGIDLEFPILPDEEQNYDDLRKTLALPAKTRYICLHAGARDVRRRWPAANFALVGDALMRQGYTVVLTGSEDERTLLDEVASRMHQVPINLVRAAGHVGLGELAALLRDAAFLISNDTGVSHIAAALRVPSLVLFSPYSDVRRWAPLDRQQHQVMLFDEAADPMAVTQRVLEKLERYSVATS